MVILNSLVVLVVSLGLGILSISIATGVVRRDAEASMFSQAEIAADLVSETIQSRLMILQELANQRDVRSMDFETQKAALIAEIDRIGADDFAVIYPDGTAVHLKGGQTINLSNRDYVQKGLQGVAVISDIIVGGTGAVAIPYPLINITVNFKDEISDMAQYFNRTMEKIKNMVIAIKQEAVHLFTTGDELASHMTKMTAAINQIATNIQNITDQAISQNVNITETNTTMEQIAGNLNNLNSQVENQIAKVSQSSSAIEEMLANIQSVTQTLVKNAGNVKQLMEASGVGRTGLQEVVTDIQEIARESEGLLEINRVMENIASQTNLLSMNAAIEAAHAGEAGKGFGVVAGEIRKLAESSGQQSKTIGMVLKRIKDSIDKITFSTRHVLNKFEAIDSGVKTVSEEETNIRNAMKEQGVGSKRILEVVSQLNDSTQQLKSESEHMLQGSREVTQKSRNLERVTGNITKGMNAMAAGAEQITAAVKRVNTISGENKENIHILVKEVSKFKVE
jgi:methyl-accepting chemotaxis protein